MKTLNELKTSSVGRTYLTAGLLSVFVSLSFFNTVLVADEVFVVFSFGPEFVANPWMILSGAVSSSLGGWATGRFISPLSHVLSNAGVFLNEVTANVLSIDQIHAYSLWRVIMLTAITLSTMTLVHTLLVGSQVKPRVVYLVMALASVVIPSGFVTNNEFSAIRAFTWSYGIFTLVAIWLIIALITLAFKQADATRPRKHFGFLVAIVALLFATTYELTQALGPVALLVANFFLWNQEVKEKRKLKKLKSILVSKFNLLFVAFFSIPFLVIRIDSLIKCASGCYQTASLNPTGFSLGNSLNRAVSALPPLSQTVGLQYQEDWILSGTNLAAALGAIAVCLFAISSLLGRLPATEDFDVGQSEAQKLLILGLTGLGIISVISIGMALSVAVQQEGIAIGTSSRDSLIMSIGTSLVVCYIFSLICVRLLSRNKLKSFARTIALGIIATMLSLNFALTFVSNTIVTRAAQNGTGAFMQSALASAVSHPDTTPQGDEIRCALILQKIIRFPEWEGHDRMLVYGLNINFKKRVGVDFCSRSINELFEEYPIK